MSNYYAVERSSDYLAHYGVRGMKWGIRKAARLMTLNDKKSQERGKIKLAQVYRKSREHLNMLNKNADREYQRKNAKEYAKTGLASLGLGVASTAGLYGLDKLNQSAAKQAGFRMYSLTYPALGATAIGATALGSGMLGAATTMGIRGSKRGHAHAVKRRDKFAKEFTNAFKNTDYKKYLKVDNPAYKSRPKSSSKRG